MTGLQEVRARGGVHFHLDTLNSKKVLQLNSQQTGFSTYLFIFLKNIKNRSALANCLLTCLVQVFQRHIHALRGGSCPYIPSAFCCEESLCRAGEVGHGFWMRNGIFGCRLSGPSMGGSLVGVSGQSRLLAPGAWLWLSSLPCPSSLPCVQPQKPRGSVKAEHIKHIIIPLCLSNFPLIKGSAVK